MPRSRPDLFGRNNSLPLEHCIEAIRGQTADAIDGARRPVNLDIVNFAGRSQAKVHAKVVLGKITSATVNLVSLRDSTGGNSNPRIERKPVALRARQFEAHPMTPRHSVIAENHRPAVEIVHYDIHIAVIK